MDTDETSEQAPTPVVEQEPETAAKSLIDDATLARAQRRFVRACAAWVAAEEAGAWRHEAADR